MSLKRGDIYYADLSPVQGSEQGGMRPVLVVQNDVGNNCSADNLAPAKAQTAHPRGPQPTGIRPDARLCGAGRANPHH